MSVEELCHEQVTPLRRSVPIASVQGTLALVIPGLPSPLSDVPATDQAAYVARYGGPTEVADPERRRLEGWAHLFFQAVVDIVSGDRPVTQVLRWCSEDVFMDLSTRAAIVARAGGHKPGFGRRPLVVRAKVVSVHSCFLDPRVVEVSAHVRRGQRSRALAGRFHLTGGRWQCVALQFGPTAGE